MRRSACHPARDTRQFVSGWGDGNGTVEDREVFVVCPFLIRRGIGGDDESWSRPGITG